MIDETNISSNVIDKIFKIIEKAYRDLVAKKDLSITEQLKRFICIDSLNCLLVLKI